MEFISYLSLSSLAPATILLYIAGVRANFCWQGLPTFNDSFMIKMMLKGGSPKHKDPDIWLPVTKQILHQMCEALILILPDYYMVQLYKSILTLAFHALLRPGEFSYSPHVVRIEHVFVDNMGVTIYLASSKTHQFPFCQRVRVTPQQQHCPVRYLLNYLAIRPIEPGVLYVGPNNLPVQYPVVLTLFDKLSEFLDLPAGRYKPHSLRIGAMTELHVKGFYNEIIKQHGRWSSNAFQRYMYSFCIITEKEAVWLLGDEHLQHLIPKFLRNRHRYPELSVFQQFEYHFKADLKMEDVQHHLLEIFQIHDHIPQDIVIIAGTNNIATCSKAQMRACSEDMVTDAATLWTKALPDSTFKLGLFVSLIPPCLWYQGFL